MTSILLIRTDFLLRINNAECYFEKMNNNIIELLKHKSLISKDEQIKEMLKASKFKKNIENLLIYTLEGIKALIHETGERLKNSKNLFLINCEVMKIKKIMKIDELQRRHTIIKVGSYFAGMIFFLYGMNVKLPLMAKYYQYADFIFIVLLAVASFLVYGVWVRCQKRTREYNQLVIADKK